MLKCQICNFETNKQVSLSKHTGFIHKLKFPNYLIQTKYNNIHPICECGCGKETRYEATKADFCKWIHGHQARIKGHFGEGLTPEQYKGISQVRKNKFASGEYEHVLKAIKENRKQPGLGDKISKGAKGIAKPKPKGFGVGRIQSEKTRSKMSETAMKRIVKTDQKHTSKLEKTFANILNLLEIEYQTAYYAKDIKAFYDFYLPKYNLIIEVDGDFWHCNPNSKHNIPKYATQQRNLIKDAIKNEWAINNGYKILRFWEDDINNNIRQVKKIILENTINL